MDEEQKELKERLGIPMGASADNLGPYTELTTQSLQQKITITKLEKLPPKLKRFARMKFKDKRRKPITVHRIPMGAAGEERRVPMGNLLEMNDPELLASFPRKSFVEAKNSDYQPILETAQKIGVMD